MTALVANRKVKIALHLTIKLTNCVYLYHLCKSTLLNSEVMEWMKKGLHEERQRHSGIHAQKLIRENKDVSTRHGCAMYNNLENRTAISSLFPLMSSMFLLLLKSLVAEATFSGKLKSMFLLIFFAHMTAFYS